MNWYKWVGPVYWLIFVACFLGAAIWESFAPRRRLQMAAERRWMQHGILFAVSFIFEAIVVRVSPVAVAIGASERQTGILHLVPVPFVLACGASILFLDLVRYGTHRLLHSVGVLWRVHEVHHSDPEYDVSTAARFHPIEVAGTQACYLAAVWMLGAPPLAVLISEMLAVVINLLGHTNAALPDGIERIARYVFITPDVHRTHHSEEIAEQSSNFGQTFVFWDRLFGTFTAQPCVGHTALITGIKGLQNAESLELAFMVLGPFRSQGSREENPAMKPGS